MINILRRSLRVCGLGVQPCYTIATLKDNIFTVSLIGKPNVGKSSLFNRLSGGLHAITDSLPGLTRDRNEFITKIWAGGVPIRFVDTAGWESLTPKEQSESEIKRKMIDQTSQALVYSDLALFVIDAKEGITTTDHYLAQWLRKRYREKLRPDALKKLNDENQIVANKIILVANKCEYEDEADLYRDVYRLGFGDPLMVSAEQGDGMQDLIKTIEENIPEEMKKDFEARKGKRIEKFRKLKEKLKREILDLQRENKEDNDDIDITVWEKEFDKFNKDPEENSDLDSDAGVDPEQALVSTGISTEPGVSSENFFKNRSIQISIVGKPNVGKSSLVNSLLKEKRVIVDDMPGTTRDAISVSWQYKGKRINLIDTAGIEKSLKFKKDVDKKIHRSTLNAIKYSHVILCTIDSINAFRVQDLSVAQYIADQGRGLILLVNKWDLVEKEYRSKATKFMQKQVERALNEVKDVPMIYISAKTGYKVDSIMDEVLKVYEKWNLRVSTGILNNWMKNLKKLQLLPTDGNADLKIRFISQIKSRPPTFAFFVNDKSLFKENYLRFVKAKLTEEFGLQGVPIRVLIRDINYKANKKYLEKIKKVGKIKKEFLKKRRLASHARKKLEELNVKLRNRQRSSSKTNESEQKL